MVSNGGFHSKYPKKCQPPPPTHTHTHPRSSRYPPPHICWIRILAVPNQRGANFHLHQSNEGKKIAKKKKTWEHSFTHCLHAVSASIISSLHLHFFWLFSHLWFSVWSIFPPVMIHSRFAYTTAQTWRKQSVAATSLALSLYN